MKDDILRDKKNDVLRDKKNDILRDAEKAPILKEEDLKAVTGGKTEMVKIEKLKEQVEKEKSVQQKAGLPGIEL